MFVKINQQLLNRAVLKAGIGEEVAAARILKLFSQYLAQQFDEAVLKEAQPLYLKHKSLIIKVGNSSIAAEIKKREAEAISFLHKQTNFKVKRIIFVS